jgi:predicted ABC-type ATPase
VAEKKPLLVVIAGPHGSGKSVVTEILRSSYEWSKGLLEINPDKIAQEEFGDWNDLVAWGARMRGISLFPSRAD